MLTSYCIQILKLQVVHKKFKILYILNKKLREFLTQILIKFRLRKYFSTQT